MHATLLFFVLSLLLCTMPARAAEPMVVPAYNTYLFPPFLNADGSGIAADLVNRLNAHLGKGYQLQLQNVPRRRLTMILARETEAFDGVGLLLAPAFVGDIEQTKFSWSEKIFYDSNVLIFAASAPPIHSFSDLKGMRFGAVLGNFYRNLDELAAEGVVTRIDVSGELLNLHKVIEGRVEFTQMNRLLFNNLSRRPDFAGKLKGIPEPSSPSFARRMFVGRKHRELLDKLNAALYVLPCDATWRASAQRYDFTVPACLIAKKQ